MPQTAKLAPAAPARPLRLDSPELQVLLDRISEGSAARDREREAPFEVFRWIRAARLGALRVPAETGGGGISLAALFAFVTRLAEADSNVAHILRNHYAFVERHARFPVNEQEREWQALVLEGAIFGLSSSELDSKVAGQRTVFSTTVEPTADGDYVLNGKKYYSTGNLYADYIVVRAQVPNGAAASVIVPVDREGVTIADDWDGMGQRLTGTGTTIYDKVRVPARDVVADRPGAGYGTTYASTFPQLYLTHVNAGILRAILRDAAALVRNRGRSFYHAPAARPAEDPLLLQIVGQISANAFAADAATAAAAAALDAVAVARDTGADNADDLALDAALAAARAKLIVDELTIRSGALIFDVGGASASKQASNLDRHWRNARTLASHNPGTYKALALGNFEVNAIAPPNASFF